MGSNMSSFLQKETVQSLMYKEKFHKDPFVKILETHDISEAMVILENHHRKVEARFKVKGSPRDNEWDAHPITSAPVWSEIHETELGIFSAHDAVKWLDHVDEGYLARGELDVIRDKWLHAKLSTCVTPRSMDSEMVQVSKGTTLRELLVEIVATHTHRICVVNPGDTRIQYLITQSAIVDLIVNHCMSKLSRAASQTLAQRKLGAVKQLIFINPADPVYDAFKLCAMYNISTVVVCEVGGPMLNYISESHIRKIHTEDTLCQLTWSCEKFLEHHQLKMRNSVSCTDTVKEVLQRMSIQRLKQVFILDEVTNKCAGILTQSDILKEIYQEEFWNHAILE